jgi:hypothetical protein
MRFYNRAWAGLATVLAVTFVLAVTMLPVAGGRIRYNFTDHIYANLIAFAGGTSAINNFSWDVFSGVGYQFNSNFQMFAGYRILKVGYRRDNYVYNVSQSGPVVGLAVRF